MADGESPATELKVARLEGAYEHLATRADVASLRGELRGEMTGLRGELRGEMSELRGEMGGLRGEMTGLRGEVRLLAGLVIGVQVAAVALIFSRVAG